MFLIIRPPSLFLLLWIFLYKIINFVFFIMFFFFTVIMVPPTRPNVTRLADDKVMVRWSMPPHDKCSPILFFKIQYQSLGSIINELDELKTLNWYRFRIAAVYSNNDNQISSISKTFFLNSTIQLDAKNKILPLPNITRVEPISETSIMLHWTLPEQNQIDFDGFYVQFLFPVNFNR